MKTWIVLLGMVSLLVGAVSAFAADKDFEAVANAYVEDLLKMNPEMATPLGDHRYDAQLTDRSAAAIAAQVKLSRDYLAKLAAIDPKSLGQTNAIDYEILKSNLDRAIFEAEELHDLFVAAVCTACHDRIDGRTGRLTDAEKHELWQQAWIRTVHSLVRSRRRGRELTFRFTFAGNDVV